MKEKNKIFTARGIAEIALISAIALGLDFLQGGLWRGVFVNGGSIGIAILPILILAFRKGFVPALISGFIVSFLQMAGGVYSIADEWWKVLSQIACDYIFAYPAVALAGLFYKNFHSATDKKHQVLYVVLGTVVGGLGKFIFHFISGVVFFPNTSIAGAPALYSLVYNGGYMLPNILISAIILSLVVIKAPQLFIENNTITKKEKGEMAHE